MADPKKPVSPYANTKVTGKKAVAASPYAKTNAKPAETNPVLAAGQSVLDAISTPLYFVEGAINEGVNQAKAGKVDLGAVLGAAGKNATSWTRGEQTILGSDLLKNMGVIGAKGSGSPIEENTPGAFIAGLGADIILDPTNLIPGKVLLTGAKAATSVAKGAVIGAKDAISGVVPLARAVKGKAAEEVAALTEKATMKPLSRSTDKLFKAGYALTGKENAAAARYTGAVEKIANVTSPVVKLDAPRSVTEALGQTLGSAFDTAKAALVTTVVQDNAINFIDKFARKEAKALKRNPALAEATLEGMPGHLATDAATGVSAKRTATKLADGNTLEFPKFTPYKATNGKIYVSNGEKAYSFPTEAAARAYITSTGETAAKTVAGANPIFDTAATSIPLPSMIKIPTTAPEAKAAQKSLDLIQSLAKTAEATVSQGRGKKPQVVTYNGFTDLVAGLKAGHSVDYASLTKIIDALDPSRQWVKGVEGLSDKRAYQFVSELLTTAGVQTAAKVQERLDLMNAHTILKGQGVAFSETAATYVTLRLSQGGQKALASAVGAEELAKAIEASRDASMRRIREADIAPRPEKKGIGKQLDRVTNGVNRAFTKRFGDILDITKQKQYWEEITNMGDLAVRNTEDAWDAGSRAILKLQLNQSYQAGLIGSLLGLATYRDGKRIASDLEKGIISIEGAPAERMARFISDLNLSQDVISGTLGSRLVHIRVQDPNLSKQLPPNFVYLHLGDIMEAFRQTGKSNLMEEAFFPVGPGIERTTDSMSFSGVVEAARHILEMQQLNKSIARADVVRMILSRSKDQVASTPEFLARVDNLAEKIADHLLAKESKAVAMLTQTHKSRLIAAADEALASAETLSRDLFDNMLQGMEANLVKGVNSEEERLRLVKELFQKFVYLSGAFKAQSTEVGESVLRTAAMVYINDGKLANLLKEKGYKGEQLLTTQDDITDLLNQVNNMFKTEGPAKISRTLNGVARKASEKQVNDIISKYEEARLKYDRVRNELAGTTDQAGYTAWAKKLETAQTALVKQRDRMDKVGLPTQHWTPEGWIPSENYNELLVRQAAGETTILDAPLPTKVRAIPVDKQSAIYKEYALKNLEQQLALRATDAEEASTIVLSRLAEIEKQYPDDPMGQAEALAQQVVSEQLKKGITQTTRATLTEANTFVGAGTYNAAKTGEKALAQKVSKANLTANAKRSFAERSGGELWSAKSGRNLSYAFMVEAQSRYNMAIQTSSHALTTLVNKYINVVGEEDFHTAFAMAVGKTIPRNTAPEMKELALDIRKATDAFFGKNGAIIASGIDGKSIQAAFERFGLGNVGIPDVSKWAPDRLANLLNDIESPFGKLRKDATPTEIEQFNLRQKMLRESGRNPIHVMSSMIQAIEHAKMEKHIIQSWHEEFSYMNVFSHIADPIARYNKAVAEGWVGIKILGGTTDLTAHLPSPTKGGLYHPSMAREFASMNREWNMLYNSGKMPKLVQAMMEITNIFKFTQTVLNPRHHVQNIIGDTSAALVGGARDPQQWLKGMQLSAKVAVENAEIDYATIAKLRGGDNYELSIARAVRFMQPANATEITKASDATKINPLINGKRINYDDATFIKEMKVRGIVLSQQLLSDQKLLNEGIQMMEAQGVKGQLGRTILQKTREGLEKVERPFGDLAAAYGNGPRITTAISEMMSKNWKSEREMWNAISEKVHTLHPSILSLSAFERRYPRVIASYYTWIRGAHNALMYMALNHTAAMMVYSKAQYNAAEATGLDPQSIGTPWGDKSKTPGYLDYSVYGPTQMGPNGPMLFKPAQLPLDVIDTWNIQFDSTQPFETNVIQNIQGLGQSVIGKNINMLLQPGLELVTRTDPATGKPTQIKDLASLGDKAASMFGPTQLLKGLGLYTPANKGEGSANPLTPRQREVALTNWLGLTQKAQDINSPANVKNAQSEEGARQKRILEQLIKNQGQK